MVHSWIVGALYLLAIVFAVGGVLFSVDANWLVATLMFLGAIYLASKSFQLRKQVLQLCSDYFTYGRKNIAYKDIKEIVRVAMDKYTLGNVYINILASSSIYIIRTSDENIEIISKLYKDSDTILARIAKRANIPIKEHDQ